jgi:small subunit ribosomal protein S8
MSSIRNAEKVGKQECLVAPSSKLIGRVLKVMADNNYIKTFEFVEDAKAGKYKVRLNGHINECGVVRPRHSIKLADMEKFESRYLPAQDFGVLILTTTKGIISHVQAKELGIGGKLLAFVY